VASVEEDAAITGSLEFAGSASGNWPRMVRSPGLEKQAGKEKKIWHL